ASSDTVSVIDTKTNQVVETIACRTESRLPFGSGCNALALGWEPFTLLVANGSNNCIAFVRLGEKTTDALNAPAGPSKVEGVIPTGWYPGAVVPYSKKVFVANVKGHGSVGPMKKGAKGHNSHDHLGSVSVFQVPSPAQLAAYTAEVHANNRLTFSLMGLEKP